MATIELQEVIFVTRPLTRKHSNDIVHVAPGKHGHTHLDRLSVDVALTIAWTSAKDPRKSITSTSVAPFIAKHLNATVKSSTAKYTEDLVHGLNLRGRTDIVDVQDHRRRLCDVIRILAQ
jgi:hypothetical protein